MQINWQQVIDDLERVGVSIRSQAVEVDVSLGTMYYWKSGGEPKYRNGRLLLNLYEQRVGLEPPRASSTGRTMGLPVVVTPMSTSYQATARST